MPTFGEDLRREREMRGVTLEEISESTKISVRLLSALEADDFTKLPGGVFTRSFIRSYAQYLGLDEEHVLAEYKRSAQPGSDNDFSRLTAGKPLPSRTGSQPRTLPWVVAAVLLASGYAVYRYSHRSLEVPIGVAAMPVPSGPSSGGADSAALTGAQATAGTASGQEAGAQGNGAGASEPPNSRAQQTLANATSKAAEAPAQTAVGEGDLVLQVSTSDDVWLAVAADGKTVFQQLLPPDSVRSFRAKDSFDVTTGNAQGTTLTLDGEAQKPLGRHGEFKKVHLTRADFRERTP